VSVAQPSRMEARVNILFRNTIVRYLFAFATVAGTFALRTWLIPFTGTSALLFFAAVMVTSLFAGVGPGICALLISLPLAGYTFVPLAGYPPFQAAFQALLFAIDGIVIIYLTYLMKKGREAAQDANRQLRCAHEESTRSMARTRDIIELSPDAFFQADLEGRFKDVNQAACRLLGYDRDELIGKTIFDIIPVEDAPRLEAVRADLLTPGRVDRAGWTLIRKDGTFVPAEVSSNILSDGRWQAFVRDISERKRFEDEHQIFVTFLENSPDFIGIADPNGKPVYVNPAGRRMVGLPANYPVENTQIPEYYPSDQRAFASDVIVRSMVEQGRWHGETYFRHWQTQEAIPVSDEHFMIRDPETGRVLGMGTITRDISDARRIAAEREQLLAREQLARRQAETANEQLKDSERRLTFALDSAQMGMWDLDLLTDTSVRSLRHDQIFGYSSPIPTWGAEIFMTHVVPEDREVAKQAFEKAFVSDNFDMECRILWADGSIHWISARGRVSRNQKGDPVRMVGTVQDITEHKRAEEALQRSEREFRELAESMPQIVWATTADGLNIYFNQQWVDYTGLTLEESYSEGWITPFHPDDRQRAWDAWQRATQHRDTYSLECRLRRADGVYQWWLIRGVPLLSANGEIRKWFGTCTDIEQIKVAEQRLTESEAKFSGIISISADAIISIDDEQRITLFNNGAEQIFGYSRSEAIGAPLDILIPDRFRSAHRQHVERFAGGGSEIARRMGERLTTIAGLRKNGEEFAAEAAISKLRVGEKTLLTVALRDITERKRFEKEQQFLAEVSVVLSASLDSDQTLYSVARLVVQNVADWCAVDVVDEHGNLSRLKVASADPAKAALCAVLEQMPPDRDLPHLMRSVVESKRPVLIEHVTPEYIESLTQGPEHLQALLATRLKSFVAVPLLVRGRPLGALFFGSSTPSRVYRLDDLRLAEAVADRAAIAIENGRLYRASVHATQLRDQVLGVVAHDLRNPLSTIQMQASLLKRHGPEPERRSLKPAEVIQRAANRMNRLIQDLLDVALMEAGQLTIERSRLSASWLIVEAVDMQRPLASSSSLELRVEVDPDVPAVWGDRDRLLQVFENLIGNAIKFTKAGGRITAGATSRDDEVVFWVADTGCGIESENLPRVFDRFWQATRAGRQGAGLGLPITKGIVGAHGGRIWVESTAGSGSTFFFTIPKVSAAQDRLSDPGRPDRAA
jgi:PAS domain S-box-containing protein